MVSIGDIRRGYEQHRILIDEVWIIVGSHIARCISPKKLVCI